MVTRATLACALFPDRLPEFRQVCRDQNILFPDRRLMHHSRSNRYRRWLYVLLKNGAQSLKAATQLNAEVFAAQLVKIRRDLETLADRLFEAPSASSPLTRRWQIQDQRFVLNRLFYLTPLDEFGKLLRHVPPEPEHLEFRALLAACMSGNPESLLQFPGPAVATFCSVAEKIGSVSISEGRLRQPSAANAAALSNLFLSGALNPAKGTIKGASLMDTRLLLFARFNPSPIRETWEIDYLHELHSLQLGFNSGTTRDLLLSRFDWEEDMMLEALTIGGDGYYSV